MSSVQWPCSSHHWPLELLVKLLRHCTTRPEPDTGVAVESASWSGINAGPLQLWAPLKDTFTFFSFSMFLERALLFFLSIELQVPILNCRRRRAKYTVLLLFNFSVKNFTVTETLFGNYVKKMRMNKNAKVRERLLSWYIYVNNTGYTVCTCGREQQSDTNCTQILQNLTEGLTGLIHILRNLVFLNLQ